jgi:methylated-DNA-[protein]-cysteine S-methyltransferase
MGKRKQGREMNYHHIDTRWGRIGFAWTYVQEKPLIKKISLPAADGQGELLILNDFPHAVKGSDEIVVRMGDAIRQYLDGGSSSFSLEYLDIQSCRGFQKRVLLQDYKIPRGMVFTYGGIARKLSMPGAARAIGTAQAGNPFPIIIPCHRVVRSDRTLGGFGGGIKMKKALLQLEGVAFDKSGKVLPDHLWS